MGFGRGVANFVSNFVVSGAEIRRGGDGGSLAGRFGAVCGQAGAPGAGFGGIFARRECPAQSKRAISDATLRATTPNIR
jgi:hypothetical protein